MRSIPVDVLRAFVAVVEARGFTRAAEELGRSQPTVSLQVKRLEELAEAPPSPAETAEASTTKSELAQTMSNASPAARSVPTTASCSAVPCGGTTSGSGFLRVRAATLEPNQPSGARQRSASPSSPSAPTTIAMSSVFWRKAAASESEASVITSNPDPAAASARNRPRRGVRREANSARRGQSGGAARSESVTGGRAGRRLSAQGFKPSGAKPSIIGATLFEKVARFELTPVGAVCFEYGKRLIRLHDDILDEASRRLRRPTSVAPQDSGRAPSRRHVEPIECLWALMHENVTHNRDYKTFAEFRKEIITFLRYEVPRNWRRFCDRITDNFRVIRRADFRVIAQPADIPRFAEKGNKPGARADANILVSFLPFFEIHGTFLFLINHHRGGRESEVWQGGTGAQGPRKLRLNSYGSMMWMGERCPYSPQVR